MTWANARKLIEARRLRVAQLHVRGLSTREIESELERQGFVNPETGKQYKHGTIVSDLQELRKRWRESADRDIADHRAGQLAELAAVKRAAWAAHDYNLVRQAIADEAKMLGTNAPDRQEVTGANGGPVILAIGGLDPDEDI